MTYGATLWFLGKPQSSRPSASLRLGPGFVGLGGTLP